MTVNIDGVRLHHAELDRLDSLASYGVLDTPPEAAFDALTALAARLCCTPLAAVSLVDADRQWFKSRQGLTVTQTPRALSFCSDAVADGAPLVVPDASVHPRYRTNPLVTANGGIRAYAGVPLVGRDGLPLGALCVLDVVAREFTGEQLHVLGDLAGQVVTLLEQARLDRVQGVLSGPVRAEARDPGRLRRVLEDGQLVPHYQPLVDLDSGAVHGLEALLRWEHPELGVLLPSAFLPVLELTALVVPVGRAVLHAALAQLAQLHRQHLRLPGGVAVNVASGQLARPGLARDVFTALSRHGVPADLLTLEITEATALPVLSLAQAELGALADAGVHIVLDDFGVGWSNLSRLLELPIDGLKLDRSLAGAVLSDPRATTMVRATLQLAAELSLGVVAEGVESEPVRRHLAQAGCHLAQGWLFSPAVSGRTLPTLLHRLTPSPAGQRPPSLPRPRRVASRRLTVGVPGAAGRADPSPG